MFEALFGAGMPLAVRFFVAFLISLGLIGATAWAMLRFGTEWSGGASIHARAPRLALSIMPAYRGIERERSERLTTSSAADRGRGRLAENASGGGGVRDVSRKRQKNL